MVQSSCSVKNCKLNETIQASALWSIITVPSFRCGKNIPQKTSKETPMAVCEPEQSSDAGEEIVHTCYCNKLSCLLSFTDLWPVGCTKG